MDEQQAIDMINGLLEDTDYPVRISNVADIAEFLLDDSNRRFEFYPEVGRIYDELRERPEIDRRP